jgi:hypothetical protein
MAHLLSHNLSKSPTYREWHGTGRLPQRHSGCAVASGHRALPGLLPLVARPHHRSPMLQRLARSSTPGMPPSQLIKRLHGTPSGCNTTGAAVHLPAPPLSCAMHAGSPSCSMLERAHSCIVHPRPASYAYLCSHPSGPTCTHAGTCDRRTRARSGKCRTLTCRWRRSRCCPAPPPSCTTASHVAAS